MKKEFCPILFFSKAMATIIVILSTVNLIVANAAVSDFSLESFKASIMQWLFGLIAASGTIIAGYVASVFKMAIKYAYDFIRAKIANTIIGEILDDINTFSNNSVDIFKDKLGTALTNDGKVDKKEIEEIVNAMYDNAVAIWGIKKIDYLGKYKENAVAWVKSKFEEKVREWIESFRWEQLRTDNVPVEPAK